MRGFLAVARREIAEKRFVFGAALVASVVPFAVPLVRGLHGPSAAEARDWLAIILASIFAAGLAVGLGTTALASDLVERRASFYFSRPISGFALWAGKLGATCLMVCTTAAIVYAPTLLLNGGRVVLTDLPPEVPAAFAAVALGLVFVFHAGHIVLRPRSPLLLLDIGALLLLSLGAMLVVQRLTRALAAEALDRALTAFVVVVPAALLAAGLLAVVKGRTDSRRAHAVLSTTLWGALAVFVGAATAYAQWVLSSSPNNLEAVDTVTPAPRGPWVVAGGPARGGVPVFLLDTMSGHFWRVGSGWHLSVISPDGRHAAWFDASGPGESYEVFTLTLDDPSNKPERRRILLPTFPGDAFLSEGGERLATVTEGTLSVVDLRSGASLASARLADPHCYASGFFVGPERVRVFQNAPLQVDPKKDRGIFELDIATRSFRRTGRIETAYWFVASPDPDKSRLVTLGPGGEIVLRDGRTGAALTELLPATAPAFFRWGAVRFISDGHIAVAITEKAPPRLEVFSWEGRRVRTILLPEADRATLGGEASPGKLLVSTVIGDRDRQRRNLLLVDVATGDVRQVGRGLFPIAYLAGYLTNRFNDTPAPGAEATKLFYGPDQSLVRFDPLTGERRVILGGRQH